MKKITAFFVFVSIFLMGAVFVSKAEANTLSPYTFTLNMKKGIRNIEVAKLQEVLNQEGDTQVATSGLGSPANESTYYGSLTVNAVSRFQEKYASEILTPAGLTKPTGKIGYYTRLKLNALRAQYALGNVLPPGPIFATSTPTAVGSSYATLNATIDSKGQVFSGFFKYSTDTSFSSSTTPVAFLSNATSFSAYASIFSPSTTYNVKACIVNNHVSGANYTDNVLPPICDSGYKTFTTTAYYGGGGGGGGGPIITPTVTTSIPSSIMATVVMFSMSYVTNGLNVTPFFEYGTSTNTNQSTILGNSSTTNGSYNLAVTGLSPSTLYYVKSCVNYSNTTLCDSNVQSFTTLGIPTLSLTTTSASNVFATTATLNATYVATISTPTIQFQYGTTTNYGTTTTATLFENVNAALNISGLLPNTLYYYRAIGTNGNASATGTQMTFTTAPQVTLSAYSVTNVLQNGATISVNFTGVPVDQSGMSSTLFKLQYGTTQNYGSTATQAPLSGDYRWLASSGTWSKTISGLSMGTTYHFRVVTLHQPGNTNEIDGPDGTFTTLPPMNNG